MLNKSHRSVVSTCVLIFMPYFKKETIKNSLKKKHFFFCKKKTRSEKNCFFHITSWNSKEKKTTKILDIYYAT